MLALDVRLTCPQLLGEKGRGNALIEHGNDVANTEAEAPQRDDPMQLLELRRIV